MERDFIIQCEQCGSHVAKASVYAFPGSENVDDAFRTLLTREHAATHKAREFHCVMGHTLSPPDTDTDNRGNGYAGCRQHGDWTLSRSSQSDG